MRIKIIGKFNAELQGKFIESLELAELNCNQQVLFCDYSEYDIPIGYCFTKMVTNSGNVVTCQIILKNVSQQFFLSLDEIPHGWKTVCKFEFVEGNIPYEVERLPSVDGWKNIASPLFFE